MQILKKTIKVLCIILIPISILLYAFGYGYIFKGLRVVYLAGHTSAYIDDGAHFDNHTISKSTKPIEWEFYEEGKKVRSTTKLDAVHEKLGTIAYLVIKNDRILYEKYFEDYSITSATNSFSMAKSIVTYMLGKAIMNGEIKSLDQPVGDFIPEFKQGLAAKLTVGDLSSMASGLNWDESYSSPFAITARSYLTEDLEKVILGLKVVEEPGVKFQYLSGNTQLLGMVLRRATGKTLAAYASEHFWEPMGMEQDAFWQVDSEEKGMEKAYCCIASNARDFAKFGKMLNHRGTFDGKTILDTTFVKTITQARFEDGEEYGYGLWLSNYHGKKIVVMRGILGQYVISIPEDQLIIVRLGHKIGKYIDKPFREDFYTYIDETYKMIEE